MKRRLIVILIGWFASLSLVQTAQAGGAPFTTLSFPGATTSNCGSWLANGGGGLATVQTPINYMVTDGNGVVVASGQFVGMLDNGIRGSFTTVPTKNPLHFIATSTYLTDSYNVGDLYADDACLPDASAVQVQPTCPGDLMSQLAINTQGYVLPGLPNALRDKPGLSRDGSTVLEWLPEGTSFKVLAGPVCVSGYAWWYVAYDNDLGWTPEGTGSVYWLAPLP